MPAHQGAGSGTAACGSVPPTAASRPGAEVGTAQGRLQAAQVRAMFDRIAGVYDLMNTAMTAGLHHRWRQRAAQLAAVRPGQRVLDVATGTGDMAIELASHVAPDGEVVGSDFSEPMLERARSKAQRASGLALRLRFQAADALALPYGDDCFDAATVAFGLRNFSDLQLGLRELARVVRPGGRVVVLEITTPTRAPLSLFYSLWFDRLVPLLGRIAAGFERFAAGRRSSAGAGGIAAAYSYLPSSVRRFPAPAALAAQMRQAGLGEVRWVLLAGSIIAIHVGTVEAVGAGIGEDHH